MTTKYITLSLLTLLNISFLNAMEGTFDELKCMDVSKKINEISSESAIEISYEISKHNDAVSGVCFSPDGNYFATGSIDKSIRVYAKDDKCKWRIQTMNPVTALCWSPNSQYLIAGLKNGSLAVYDVKNHKGVALLPYPDPENLSFLEETVAPASAISSASMSSDSKFLALGTVSGNILLLNVEKAIAEGKWNTVKLDTIINGHEGRVAGICFHFNDDEGMQWFASCSVDKTIKIWKVEVEGYLFMFEGHTDEVLSICFSSDCKSIASCSADKTIKIWDLGEDLEYGEYKEAKYTLQGHSDTVSSVRYNSDGTILLSGSHDKTVKIWDMAAEPKELKSLEIDSGVCHLGLSTNNKYILVGLNNGGTCMTAISERSTLDRISDILHDKKEFTPLIKEIFPTFPLLTRLLIITALKNSNKLAYLLPQLLPSQNRI